MGSYFKNLSANFFFRPLKFSLFNGFIHFQSLSNFWTLPRPSCQLNMKSFCYLTKFFTTKSRCKLAQIRSTDLPTRFALLEHSQPVSRLSWTGDPVTITNIYSINVYWWCRFGDSVKETANDDLVQSVQAHFRSLFERRVQFFCWFFKIFYADLVRCRFL